MKGIETLRGPLLVALFVSSLSGCEESRTKLLGLPPPEVVPQVTLEKYAGTWYEIARIPNQFQEGCAETTTHYEIRNEEKGKVKVTNRCRKEDSEDKWKTVKGTAKVFDEKTNAKLKVTFLWPFIGDYWILDLADDYSYAAVGTPDRNNLWILARSPDLDEATFAAIVERMKAKQYPVEDLVRTAHGTVPVPEDDE